jgi:hypothetical protein
MRKYLIMLFAVMLSACGGGGGGSSTPPPPQPTSQLNACVSNTSPTAFQHTFGNLLEVSNVWGASNASSYNVCLNNTIDNASGNITDLEINFSVNNVKQTNPSPIMAPLVMFGQQYGYPSSTTTVLPAPAANPPSLPVTGTVTTTCAAGSACVYDAGFDLFFSNNGQDIKSMTAPAAEIAVYTGSSGGFGGSNTPTTSTIDGISFDIFTNIMSDNNGHTWHLVQYIPHGNAAITNLSGLNLRDFVIDAQQNRDATITPMTLDTVEFDTEVINGSGITSLKNYTIQ